MASNYTVNYQLSQWEPEDKVQRADFNTDNAKIDTAIKAAADKAASLDQSKASTADLNALRQRVGTVEAKQEFRLLVSKTLGSEATYFDVSLSGISWAKWKRVYILVEANSSSGSGMDCTLAGSKISDYFGNSLFLVLFPLYERGAKVRGIGWGTDNPLFSLAVTYSSIDKINIRARNSNMLKSGASVTVWGEA